MKISQVKGDLMLKGIRFTKRELFLILKLSIGSMYVGTTFLLTIAARVFLIILYFRLPSISPFCTFMNYEHIEELLFFTFFYLVVLYYVRDFIWFVADRILQCLMMLKKRKEKQRQE